jgi:hypothetical protein
MYGRLNCQITRPRHNKEVSKKSVVMEMEHAQPAVVETRDLTSNLS